MSANEKCICQKNEFRLKFRSTELKFVGNGNCFVFIHRFPILSRGRLCDKQAHPYRHNLAPKLHIEMSTFACIMIQNFIIKTLVRQCYLHANSESRTFIKQHILTTDINKHSATYNTHDNMRINEHWTSNTDTFSFSISFEWNGKQREHKICEPNTEFEQNAIFSGKEKRWKKKHQNTCLKAIEKPKIWDSIRELR